MVKGKIKTLMYSSARDLKNYGLTALGGSSIYYSDFEPIAKIMGVKFNFNTTGLKRSSDRDIEEAKTRIIKNKEGRFEYIPSDEYIRALARIRLKNR